ncbi:MAG: leucine-rich repeat domain-containing protein, partial [Treponemataceae bacterium]|nr:leucine-rich repeat domain-containing protein [Treponemataceae bacterium]
SLTSVVIPNGVMIIGTDAFRDCTSLKSVVIPDSVTAIDKRAFFGCTSLDNVTYEGTKEEWEKIKGVNKGDLANKNIAFAK